MIYHVYSDNCLDLRTQQAIDTWYRNKNIINVNVKNTDLSRNEGGLPYIKDILDVGYNLCQNDDDIILYTNTDIGLVKNDIDFPNTNFFCVRKNVTENKDFTSQELSEIPYEDSINCDLFGITKKWYQENKHKIPDFLIGSPTWDLCMLFLINGKRLNNIIFHVEHNSAWKNQLKNKDARHVLNQTLYVNFLKNCTNFSSKSDFFNFYINNYGYKNLTNPIFITFYTPSHKPLFDVFYKSYKKHIGENYPLLKKEFNQQLCESSNYHHSGWRKTQVQKFQHILGVLERLYAEERYERIFVFCDADIVICRNILETIKRELEGVDLVAQPSMKGFNGTKLYGGFCSGFFAGKVNKPVINFIRKIYEDLLNDVDDDSKGDQYYMNLNSKMISIKALDETFFSPGFVLKDSNSEIITRDIVKTKLPTNLSIFHANYVIGVSNKLKLIEYLNF